MWFHLAGKTGPQPSPPHTHTPPQLRPVVWFSKLKLKPAGCRTAVQCSALSTLCSAYVGRIGLLVSNVLFSMCQSGCGCVSVTGGHVPVCLKDHQGALISWFVTNMIHEFLQLQAKNLHTPNCLCALVWTSACLYIHTWMIFYSADVTAPGHTHLNMKIHGCNLKPGAWMALS